MPIRGLFVYFFKPFKLFLIFHIWTFLFSYVFDDEANISNYNDEQVLVTNIKMENSNDSKDNNSDMLNDNKSIDDGNLDESTHLGD